MKVIFLDIDGVLNCQLSKSRYKGMLGVDDDKVQLLKDIVDSTGAVIVLTSTWKVDWFKCEYIEDLPAMGGYLVKKLKNFRLHILDKTEDKEWASRGDGIKEWIKNSKVNVESFVILDDEIFDYDEENLMNNLVKTSFYGEFGGLQPSHIQKAVNILNNSSYTSEGETPNEMD